MKKAEVDKGLKIDVGKTKGMGVSKEVKRTVGSSHVGYARRMNECIQ